MLISLGEIFLTASHLASLPPMMSKLPPGTSKQRSMCLVDLPQAFKAERGRKLGRPALICSSALTLAQSNTLQTFCGLLK